ncbi:MAG: shikimate dehydrogenase [Actinobacteria bacterium]|nr:shikimate dehydrogenase [Actinomycetota bacterium]
MTGHAVGADTRVAGVIGDPVRHSASPALHNSAYAALGLDFVYVAFPVRAGRGGDAVRAVPALGLAGLNVTMPHKADAARACDALSPDAQALGAVNTVIPRPDGTLFGDSTDGDGFLRALHDDAIDVTGRSVLVLGAGGAARAVVLALGRAGAHVVVAARRPDAAADAAALAPGAQSRGIDELERCVASVDVVVNATPLGMRGEHPPFDPGALAGRGAVVDLVYHPARTPLLLEAEARGVEMVTNGLGMLVHQAALAFRAMTGVEAPLEVMRAAVGSERHTTRG